nr:ribonuclease H-like domain-containing protein [Tanacetum cinerariifolium]
MVTRSQSGIVKPLECFLLHTASISPIPKTYFVALQNSHWRQAMLDEYNSLIKNGTWILVPKPVGVNMVVRSMWLFKHKFHANGTLSRYKARLVANGSSQHHGIDVDETFSPVVKPATIRTILSLAVSRKWPIHQLDVKNAFLNGNLSETMYMHQPPGFTDPQPDTGSSSHLNSNACNLRTVFNQRLFPSVHVGDAQAISIQLPSHHLSLLHLFPRVPLHGTNASVTPGMTCFVLYQLEFDMTDLGALNYFLGISAMRSSTSLFLSQKKYACELLERANMVNCNPSRTPVDTDSKLGPEGVAICLYMHDPREPHFAALKRILRYVRGTVNFGLQLYAFATTSIVGYTDADWAGCPSTRRFTSGYCVFLGDNLLSWSSKGQHTISRSSAEVEYRGVANVVAKTAWLRNLLRELHSPLSTATLVYCDNVTAVYLSANPVQHQRTKHIKIDIHFVRDMVQTGHIRVLHVPSRYQYADIFTKGLLTALFEDFCSSLSVRLPPAQTVRPY